MSTELRHLLEELKQAGATSDELKRVRAATISVVRNQGVVAGTVRGPVAVGPNSRAIQTRSTARREETKTTPLASEGSDSSSTSFWDRAMAIVKSTGSVAEAVQKIVALASGG